MLFMETLRNFISAFLGLLLLTHCNIKQESDRSAHILSASTKTQSGNPLTGEWKFSNTIWYSSELTLQDNGTFNFHDQGCYGQKFSEGQWKNNDGTIQLTSFDSFKPKELAEVNKLDEVADQKMAKRKLKKGEVEYTFVGFKDDTPPLIPGPNDTVRIYLDKVRLQLINDTLVCVGFYKLPEEAKFYRIKNNH
jgi:hypothetical protein